MAAGVHGRARIGRSLSAVRDVASLPGWLQMFVIVAVAAAIVLIAAIGLSRIYLGVHWPSDVLGGFLGGVPPLVLAVHLISAGSRPASG